MRSYLSVRAAQEGVEAWAQNPGFGVYVAELGEILAGYLAVEYRAWNRLAQIRRFYEAAGCQLGYRMPRYSEDGLDGVTCQKFFDQSP